MSEPRPCDIAVVGLACSYAMARTAAEFWQNIVGKVDAVTDVSPERWDVDSLYDPDPAAEDTIYCRKGGWLGSSFVFNPLKYGIMPRAVEGAEPDQFLALRAVCEALEDAGYDEAKVDGRRVSVILGRGNYLGAGMTALLQRGIFTRQFMEIIRSLHPEYSAAQLAEIKATLRSALPRFHAENAAGLIPNLLTGRVANRMDFMGRNFTVDAACASTHIAVELGVRGLTAGAEDLVLAGGVHVLSNGPFLQVFDAMQALSLTSTIRPFDMHADGTIAGEGVGVLALKRLADAERDGDRVYAVIKGIGVASDGKAKSVTAPRLEGEELALRRAYEMCGLLPQSVELIEAHGTATPIGDVTEAQALHRVFGPREGDYPTCALGSVKSMIGHTMPAAGAAGLIKTVLALYHRVLPPTLNIRKPLPQVVEGASRFYLNSEPRPWIRASDRGPRRAGVNAFGFGGVNAHVIFEEYGGDAGEERASLLREWESEVFVIEAGTRDALRSRIASLRDYAARAAAVPLRDIARTLNTALDGSGFRLSVVASTHQELVASLDQAARRLEDASTRRIQDTKGIYYFEDSLLAGKVALLFPGEGSQYLDMLADLCIHFPEVRATFDAADAAVSGARPPSVDIFPPPFFSVAEEAAAADRLYRNIERATEAVLTADGACYQLLARLGFRPDMMAGHSAGEWVALAASGILDIDEFVGSMGRLGAMYRRLAEDTDVPRAVMMAVGAGREKVEVLAREIDRRIYIANDNCLHQVVIVTAPEDAEAVLSHLQARGLFVEKLAYDRGYHSPVFTYMSGPLREYFSSLRMSRPRVPVYCCTTAQPFPEEPGAILDLVTDTFARPLIFRQMIEAMYEAGARVFVEAGPRGNLTAFVNDILRGRPHLAIALDQFRRPALTTLNHALGLLAAVRHPLQFDHLYRRRGARKLVFDPGADAPADEARQPGAMEVSICYPRLMAPEPPKQPIAAPVPVNAPPASVPQLPPAPEVRVPRGAHVSQAVWQQHYRLMEEILETEEAVMVSLLRGSGPAPPPPRVNGAPAAAPAAPPEPAPFETEPPKAVVPAASPAPPPVVPAPGVQPSLREVLLNVVSERTGYPIEMLAMDQDMEADLGIDSIKRVEILGVLQRLGDGLGLNDETPLEEVARLKTLQQVLDYLEAAAGHGAASPGLEPGRPLTRRARIALHQPEREVVAVLELERDEHLYLEDHRFDPPPNSDYDPEQGGLAFVPMTMSVEMMAEAASLLCPGQRLVGAARIQALKWIDHEKGRPNPVLTLTATRLEEGKVRAAIRRHNGDQPSAAAGETLAEGVFLFAGSYSQPPEVADFQLVNRRTPAYTGSNLYVERRMFHGPSFQGVESLDGIGDNGILAQLRVLPAVTLLASDPHPVFQLDGCLLDAAGQLVGYWPLEYWQEGFVLFPIGIHELTKYCDNPAPGTPIRCEMRLAEANARTLKADLYLFTPEGKLWMRVLGWQDWRFYMPQHFYDFWRFPNKGLNSRAVDLALPAGWPPIDCRRLDMFAEVEKGMWETLWAHLVLSRQELEEFRGMTDAPARSCWIFERAIAKDAVRMWLKGRYGRQLFPADVEITTRPGVGLEASGRWQAELDTTPAVSVSYWPAGKLAVAIAAPGAVGIEIWQDDGTPAANYAQKAAAKALGVAHLETLIVDDLREGQDGLVRDLRSGRTARLALRRDENLSIAVAIH